MLFCVPFKFVLPFVTFALPLIPAIIMYALVDWLGEGKSSILKLTAVKTPRKEICHYHVGEVVTAQCQGFRGQYEAKIIAINGKKYLF